MDLDKYGPVPVASDSDFVVCPECGSEFQPHVKVCIDCGAATVSPEAARTGDLNEPGDLPLDEAEAIHIRTNELEWIESLRVLFEQQHRGSQSDDASAHDRHIIPPHHFTLFPWARGALIQEPIYAVCRVSGQIADSLQYIAGRCFDGLRSANPRRSAESA